jgi:ADP-ribosyl-[dinitrogen reductase] hydrolase
MRLAPVPLFFHYDFDLVLEATDKSVRTTHNSNFNVLACQYYAGLIVGALKGVSKKELLSDDQIYSPNEGFWKEKEITEDFQKIIKGSYKNLNPPDIKNGGCVDVTIQAALWAFYNTDSFVDGLLSVVNLGDDSDTVINILKKGW